MFHVLDIETDYVPSLHQFYFERQAILDYFLKVTAQVFPRKPQIDAVWMKLGVK